MDIDATHFTLPGLASDGGLNIVVTRYRHARTSGPDVGITGPGARLSLVCVHAVSYYKEAWLPTIESLFELQSKAPNNRFTIAEAWSIDSPNHGQASILNEERILNRPQGITAHEWARAVQVLLKSGLIQEGSSVVALGHSAGGCVIPLTTIGYPIDNLPFSSIILVEPGIMTPQMIERATDMGIPYNSILGMAKTRKDIWPSRRDFNQVTGELIHPRYLIPVAEPWLI